MRSLVTAVLPVEKTTSLQEPAPQATVVGKPTRLVSLDAYRGFIMLAMASAGFRLYQVAKQFPDSASWQFLGFHTDHVEWIGCSFWDLIQPSFIFMVGVALPYSCASRRAKGDSEAKMLAHAILRAFLLIVLAIFLSSPTESKAGPPMTNFVFTNVLAQIGLGYVFVFLLVGRGFRTQLGVLAGILAGYTLLFALYPLPGPDFDFVSVGLKEDWPRLSGWFAHWEKNTNAAAAFDVWFLNLFPRPEPFRFNVGGYQTLSFVPSMATMILGLMAGEMLRGRKSPEAKCGVLVAAACVCLAVGLVMGQFLCPLVKRIWTPSWAVYSAGWTFAMLAGFYYLIDLRGYRRWSFPLVVVGMNSIAMYVMAQQMKPYIAEKMRIHLGAEWFRGDFGPIVQSAGILLVLWLICLWMYRRGIFLKV
jgi:predicted acyltransferase